MLLSADSLTIIFVKIYCYWTRTVGVIAKGSRGPVFFETQCRQETVLALSSAAALVVRIASFAKSIIYIIQAPNSTMKNVYKQPKMVRMIPRTVATDKSLLSSKSQKPGFELCSGVGKRLHDNVSTRPMAQHLHLLITTSYGTFHLNLSCI